MPTSSSQLFENKILPAYLKRFKSETAVATNRRAIVELCDYCKKDFLAITEAETKEYLDLLLSGKGSKSGRPLKRKTVYLKYACIRSCGSYIQANQEQYGIEYSSPFMYIEFPEPAKDITTEHVLTFSEVDVLLSTIQDKQMYLMVSLVITCGLSVKEIIELKPTQLILDDKLQLFISLKDKKKVFRYILVPDTIKEALLEHAEAVKGKDEKVFVNKHGKPLTRRVLELHVQDQMNEAGLSGWTMRDLRNTASFYMLQGGASKTQAAAQLGICERWMLRFQQAVEEMDVQAGEYNCIQIRMPQRIKEQ